MMPSENLFALFKDRFSHDLGAPFLEIPEGCCWSYGDLEIESARLARLLSAQGLQPGEGTLYEQCRGHAPDFPVVDCRADTIAAILYTSDATGRPKGAMITHGNPAANDTLWSES